MEHAVERTGILVVAGITDFRKLSIVNIGFQHRIQFGVAFIDSQREVGQILRSGDLYNVILENKIFQTFRMGSHSDSEKHHKEKREFLHVVWDLVNKIIIIGFVGF